MDQGEGCDYTIACGQILLPLKSENLEDVREEVKEKVKYYGCWPDDRGRGGLKILKVFEVSNTYDFRDEIYSKFLNIQKKKKEEEIRIKELRQLEELQKKYGK